MRYENKSNLHSNNLYYSPAVCRASANIFKPFNVSLPYWHRLLGVLLVIAGVYVFSIGEHVSGYSQGFKDGADRVINLIKEKEEWK